MFAAPGQIFIWHLTRCMSDKASSIDLLLITLMSQKFDASILRRITALPRSPNIDPLRHLFK